MMMAARSLGSKSASSSARAKGKAISLKSEYVSRSFSRSRSASIRHTSDEKRSSASRSAVPRHVYWRRSSITKPLILDCRVQIEQLSHRGQQPALQRQQPAITDGGLCLEPSLYLASQSAEVGHPLQFVVRKLDVKMILELRQ